MGKVGRVIRKGMSVERFAKGMVAFGGIVYLHTFAEILKGIG